MRKLEKIVKANHSVYKQVKREDHKAMYVSEDGNYEIFKVIVKPAIVIFDNELPEREHYPGNEDFGKFAWCTRDRKRAEEIYNGIIKEEKK